MPTFKYTAISQNGHKVTGKADAANESELDKQLSKLGMVLVRMKEETYYKPHRIGRISPDEMVWICKQFFLSLRAGLDVPGTLDSIRMTASDPSVLGAVASVDALVKQGYSLADAFAEFPRIFDEFFVNCVLAGEKSGTLPFVFDQMADYYERRIVFLSRLIKTFRYPFVSTLFTSGLIFLFLAHLYYWFVEHKWEVPDQIKQLLLVTDLSYWYMYSVLLGAFAFFIIRFHYRRSRECARIVDTALLRIPKLGSLLEMGDMARFSLFLAMLYEGGINIPDALHYSGRVMKNSVIRQKIDAISKMVGKGATPSEAFTMVNFGPDILVSALRNGERTGDFEAPLREVHRQFTNKIEDSLDAFCEYVNPLLKVLSGLMLLNGAF